MSHSVTRLCGARRNELKYLDLELPRGNGAWSPDPTAPASRRRHSTRCSPRASDIPLSGEVTKGCVQLTREPVARINIPPDWTPRPAGRRITH